MSTKHTPGPWDFIVEDGDRKIVAPTLSPTLWTRETLMSDTTYYPWCPTSDDDWRLIAAAPELLRVAELVVEWLNEEPGAHKLCDTARAAIAKVTGEAAS